MESMSRLLLIISLSSLVFSLSADAICVPRNFSTATFSPSPAPSPVQPPVQAPSLPPTSSPAPVSTSPAPVKTSQAATLFSLVDEAIRGICDKTDYSLLCISSLLPYLNGKTDPVSVLEMEIKACTQATLHATAEATRMAEDPATPMVTKNILESCQENYNDALDNLRSAVEAIPTGDVGRMNSMLSAALSDFGSCEDGFAERPGLQSLTAHFYDQLRKLASNCLAIVSVLN